MSRPKKRCDAAMGGAAGHDAGQQDPTDLSTLRREGEGGDRAGQHGPAFGGEPSEFGRLSLSVPLSPVGTNVLFHPSFFFLPFLRCLPAANLPWPSVFDRWGGLYYYYCYCPA